MLHSIPKAPQDSWAASVPPPTNLSRLDDSEEYFFVFSSFLLQYDGEQVRFEAEAAAQVEAQEKEELEDKAVQEVKAMRQAQADNAIFRAIEGIQTQTLVEQIEEKAMFGDLVAEAVSQAVQETEKTLLM